MHTCNYYLLKLLGYIITSVYITLPPSNNNDTL